MEGNGVPVALVVFIIGFSIWAFFVDLKILWHYRLQDDTKRKKAQTVVPVFAILFGLQTYWLTLLALPADSYTVNPPFLEPNTSHFGVTAFYTTCFTGLLIYVMFLWPLAEALYTADTDTRITTRTIWRQALGGTALSFTIVMGFILLVYFVVRKGKVYITESFCSALRGGTLWPESVVAACNMLSKTPNKESVQVNQLWTFGNAMGVALCTLGLVLFTIFGGIGLATIPVQLISAFSRVPRRFDSKSYLSAKKEICSQTRTLRLYCQAMNREGAFTTMDTSRIWSGLSINQYKKRAKRREAADIASTLREKWIKLNSIRGQPGDSLLHAIIQLIGGIGALGLSVIWITHLILHITKPFLKLDLYSRPDGIHNLSAFDWLDACLVILRKRDAGIVSLVLLLIISWYLSVATLVAVHQYGNQLFCLSRFNLIRHKTPMNAILNSTGLLLIGAPGTLQSLRRTCYNFTRGTFADYLFGALVDQAPFIRIIEVYDISQWLMVIIFFVTVFLSIGGRLWSKGSSRALPVTELPEHIKRRAAQEDVRQIVKEEYADEPHQSNETRSVPQAAQ